MIMEKINEFNIETADLSSSMILEASAGTGKTYSLEHLFVRYILETGLNVSEILVVTFTEKAASELKKRIKALLRKELSALEAETENSSSGVDKIRILKSALYDFSEVPIFTIHGFCQNSLSAFPVESGLPFDFRIMESDDIYRETVLDYFRMLDAENNDEYYSFRAGKPGIDSIIDFFVSLLKKDTLDGSVNVYPDKETLSEYRKEIRDFSSGKGRIHDCLRTLENLKADSDLLDSINRKMKLRIGSGFITLLLQLFDELFKSETLFQLFSPDFVYNYGRFEKLSLDWLENSERDISLLDEREYVFSSAVSSFLEFTEIFQFDSGRGSFPFHDIASSSFILGSLEILKKNLYLKKIKNSELDFSDLIKLTHEAVTCEKNSSRDFCREIGRKYSLVLIDEFQDTDNLQWDIFSSLFSLKGKRVVLIGDPKQSIYRFRGADIEVYFRALDEVRDSGIKYMLETNYRSEKRVVRALNNMFGHVFAFNSGGGHTIDFYPVKYLDDKDMLLDKGGVEFLAVENDSRFTSDEVKTVVEEIFASEIKNLLETGSVKASDICILLESNDNCRDMYSTLVSLNIPAVYDGETDLFKSDEIYIVLDFLAAVSSPFNRGSIIKTLISPLFDYQLSELPSADNDADFEKISAVFLKWKELTDRGRFSAVLEEITGRENIFPSLQDDVKEPFLIRRIGEIGGERKLTNFKHIGELLVNRNRAGRENTSELISYLVSVMEGAEQEEEKVTRLERDDRSVRIMTMHKSKGLEFPVVFFGGGMKGGDLPKSSEPFYEFVENGRRCVDLVRKSSNKAAHYCEQWEERKRLYYVAFTRAEQKLYLPLFRYSNLNYLTSLYGSMVYEELSESAAEEGLSVEIPLAVMKRPGKMTQRQLSDTVSGKIFSLVSEKYNDGTFFRVNRDIYNNTSEYGVEPYRGPVLNSGNASEALAVQGKSHDASGSVNPSAGDEQYDTQSEFVFQEAAHDRKSRNIRVVSYSSIVRGEEKHAERMSDQPFILGEKSPGDEEAIAFAEAEDVSEIADAASEAASPGEDEGRKPADTDKDILKGPQFGNLMHTLLEKSDYRKISGFDSFEMLLEDEETVSLAENTARMFFPHDRAVASIPLVLELLYKTLRGKFSLPGNRAHIHVCDLEEEFRHHELEFLLKVKEGGDRDLLNLPYLSLESGYIKGFIDLIFEYENLYYIADWKTNYLGTGNDNYRGEKLENAMAEHNYFLQMKLYMTALSRIISVRENISLSDAVDRTGGCYYFFLRGMDENDADSGVFFSPPDKDEVIRFSETFFEEVN